MDRGQRASVGQEHSQARPHRSAERSRTRNGRWVRIPYEVACDRLLLVADAPDLQLILRRTFERLGLEVDVADSPEAARIHLAEASYDAVVADLGHVVPSEESVLQLLGEARALLPRARMIVFATILSEALRRRASDLGASCCLEKPVSLNDLELALWGGRP